MLQVMEDTLNFHGRWTAAAKTDFRLPVSAILINRQIALMSMPGEPFVEFQTRWRDACPVADCLFAGYANGYFGYFPTFELRRKAAMAPLTTLRGSRPARRSACSIRLRSESTNC